MRPTAQRAFHKAFDIACRELSSLSLEDQTRKAGVGLGTEAGVHTITLPFFDEIIRLTLPGFSFTASTKGNIGLAAKIVILHYLIHCSGAPLGCELIPYEDIPGCRPYLPVFERRVVKPLLAAFGYARDTFVDAGRGLGAGSEAYGNASFTLDAFPQVPITFILWEGDEEFSPSVRVLFDRSIHNCLPLEDIVVISKMATTRILKQANADASDL